MNTAEIEFLAEKTFIQIVPNFTHGKLYLISGDVGPFQPGLPAEVPLWLGLNLKKRGKCRLISPSWMDVEKLTEKKDEETEAKGFTQMACEHYLIVAQLILSVGSDDIANAQEIKTLIKDIWDIRIAKLRSSVAEFLKNEGTHAVLNHLTVHELNTVRPFLPYALNQLNRLNKNVVAASQNSQSQDRTM